MSGRFGLMHESTFTGSMVGAGPTVFAVWGYVVAHGYGGRVNLHPVLLATAIGKCTVEDVREAIAFLCAPDPQSRDDTEGGRRLVPLAGVAYRIVNHGNYSGKGRPRTDAEQREYNRQKKAESRARSSPPIDMSKTEVDESKDPLVSSLSSSDLDPEGVQGEPREHTDLEGYEPSEALVAEAARHGLTPKVLALRIRGLRNRVGGIPAVRDRDEYVAGLLPEWATWGAPPKLKRASGPPPPLLEPSEADRHLANEHGIDLDAIVTDLERRHAVESLGLGRARELIGEQIRQTVRARRARRAATAVA